MASKKAKPSRLRQLVAKAGGSAPKKCHTCRHAEAAQLCDEFAAERDKLEPWQRSWKFLHAKVLRHLPGFTVQYCTLLNHVRNCMGMEP